MPDRHGVIADVTTGYATLTDYVDQPQFFGATVGRVANRIAGGRFSLDGREYHVPANDGANSLHGGPCGFDKVNWAVVETLESATAQSVTLRHISQDGDAGYPGTLTVTATYCLDDSNALSVHYTATTDAPTVCNLSNHAYWNLGGEGSAHGAMDHELTIFADAYLPVDAALIPTGEVRAVAGTVFDFRTPTAIGARVRDANEAQLRHGRGYDHNWVLDAASGRRAAPDCPSDRPALGPHHDHLVEPAGPAILFGQFLRWQHGGQSRQILPDGRCRRAGAAAVPRHTQSARVRLDPARPRRGLFEHHHLALWHHGSGVIMKSTTRAALAASSIAGAGIAGRLRPIG